MSGTTKITNSHPSYVCTAAKGIENVPKEILSVIFTEYLDLKTRAICCRVSNKWREINQKNVNDVGLMVSVFNKSIPTFKGYDFITRDTMIKQLKEFQLVLTTFEGNIKDDGSIFLKPKHLRKLSAIALEFDIFPGTDVKALSEQNGNFEVEVVWESVLTTFQKIYTQRHLNEKKVILYDDHTQYVYQRKNLKIIRVSGSSFLIKTLNTVCSFLNQRPIISIAGPGRIGFDAEIWSRPFLEGKAYTQI